MINKFFFFVNPFSFSFCSYFDVGYLLPIGNMFRSFYTLRL